MVLLDRNGNLMVDPSVVEKSWSHRQGLLSFSEYQYFHLIVTEKEIFILLSLRKIITFFFSSFLVASGGKYHLGGVYIDNLRKCIENTIPSLDPKFWQRKEEEEIVEEEVLIFIYLFPFFFVSFFYSSHNNILNIFYFRTSNFLHKSSNPLQNFVHAVRERLGTLYKSNKDTTKDEIPALSGGGGGGGDDDLQL
jgi:hypothetical protein